MTTPEQSYDLAVDRAVIAMADLAGGDQAAADRLSEAIIIAAAWRSDDLNIRPVLEDALNRFASLLSAGLSARLAPEIAEAADQALVDAMADVRAYLAAIFG